MGHLLSEMPQSSTFLPDGPLRQAAHSGRELLRNVLDFLAPDCAFTPEEINRAPKGNPTREMRAAKKLGKKKDSKAVIWVGSGAHLVDDQYQVLSARAHEEPANVTHAVVHGMLLTLSGILMYLLSGSQAQD
jgi:hypothetical protein